MGPWELDSRPFFGRNSENTQNWETCLIWVSKFGPEIRKLRNLPKQIGLFPNCSETRGKFINFGNLLGIDQGSLLISKNEFFLRWYFQKLIFL